MAISGLSDYGGLYNNYKVVDIPKVDFDTVKKQDAERQAMETNPVVPEISAPKAYEAPDTRTRTADLDNISLTFNTGDDFSYIGSDFSIGDLDMERAISDMHKDSILEDYQYFVGSSYDKAGEQFNNEDGRVFLKF